MKIVYMGTPDFAVAPLEKIIEDGHEVILCVTQPDREKGRGKELAFSPVKECAIKHNIPVFQPLKIKEADAIEELKKYSADIFVVAAFGQILSKEILDMPKYGCINVHASLLPKYRGASPIQSVIMDGEEKTGVTIMQMDVGLDTGDMISSVSCDIKDDDTGESLHDRLAVLGAELLSKTLPTIENGTASRTPQDSSQTCYAKMLTKDLGRLDFKKDAVSLERLIRALNSWPSAYMMVDGKIMKLWKAAVREDNGGNAPGTIFDVNKKDFSVACGKGALVIKEVQLQGKKRMDSESFLRGYKFT